MWSLHEFDGCISGCKTIFEREKILGRVITAVSVLVLACFLVACRDEPTPTAVPAPTLPAPTPVSEVVPTFMAVPTAPPPADFWTLPAEALLIEDDQAYVAAGEAGLHVFDMANPEEPTAVAYFDIEVWDVVADGEALYVVGCHKQCIYTVDLSGDAPELLDDVFQTNLFNQIQAVTIENAMMYLAVQKGIIKVVDMGERPWQIIHSQHMPDEIADLDSQYDWLYVTLPQGLYLFDVTEPAGMREQDFYPAPKPAWHEETAGIVYDTAVGGDYSFVSADFKGVRVLGQYPYPDYFQDQETRQWTRLSDLYFYHVQGQAVAVNWQSSLFYVKSWDAESRQYYLTVLRHLTDDSIFIPINLIGEYKLGVNDLGQMVIWDGRVYFVNGGITEFSLPDGYEELAGTHPVSPTVVGPPTPEVQFVRQLGGSRFSLALQENIAYVGSGKSLHIYDVTNPALPVELNTLFFTEEINEIKVHNGHAYLRMEGFEWGYLLVLDMSDPVNPAEVTRVGNFVQDIELEGDYAYVIVGYYTLGHCLQVKDICELSSPKLATIHL